MEERIKDLIARIEQIESDEEGSGIELGKLYSRMKELHWVWNTRIKQWVYDENSEEEE